MPTNTKNNHQKSNINKYLIAVIALLAVISATLGYFVIENFESKPIVIKNEDSEVSSNIEPIELEIPEPDSEEPLKIESTPPIDLSETGIESISQAKDGSLIGIDQLEKLDFDLPSNGNPIDYKFVTNPNFPNFNPLLVTGNSNTLGDWVSKKIATTDMFASSPNSSPTVFQDKFLINFVANEPLSEKQTIAYYDIEKQKEYKISDTIPTNHILNSGIQVDLISSIISYYYTPKTNAKGLEIKESQGGNYYNYKIINPFLIKREINMNTLEAKDFKINLKIPDIDYRWIDIRNSDVFFVADNLDNSRTYNINTDSDFISSSEFNENLTKNSPYRAIFLDFEQSKYSITKNGSELANLDLRNNLRVSEDRIISKDGYTIIPIRFKIEIDQTINFILIEEANPDNIQIVFDTSKNGESSPVILNSF